MAPGGKTQTHLDLGIAHLEAGRYADAIDALEAALAGAEPGRWRLEASLALGAARERLRSGTGPLVGLRQLENKVGHLQAVAQLFSQAPAYFERFGNVSPDEEAAALFAPAAEGDKVVLGVYAPERLVGCADLQGGDGVATVGLLLIADRWQGRGIGTAAHRQLEVVARRWAGAGRLRAAVVHDHARELRFWRGLGYLEAAPARPFRDRLSVAVLEKALGE